MKQQVFMKWAQQKHLSIPHLLLEHYTKLNMNEHDLTVLLHIQSLLDAGDAFPTPQTLSERMSLSLDQCAEIIGTLVRKRLLSIENKQEEDTGVMYEHCSLEPLWASLIHYLEQDSETKVESDQAEKEGQLYQRFEQEFARPLSPIEAETLSMWFDQDQHATELILAALREAVVSGKLNFRYIDRILFEWKKNGVRSPEQARTYSERFRKKIPQERKQPSNQSANIPGFHWLENL